MPVAVARADKGTFVATSRGDVAGTLIFRNIRYFGNDEEAVFEGDFFNFQPQNRR